MYCKTLALWKHFEIAYLNTELDLLKMPVQPNHDLSISLYDHVEVDLEMFLESQKLSFLFNLSLYRGPFILFDGSSKILVMTMVLFQITIKH